MTALNFVEEESVNMFKIYTADNVQNLNKPVPSFLG